ncbi:MAG: cbb3-type cytochrome oxidase assembly protein CcoS [Gemmatimonas sp.]|nr:cbb3-type cytochrome oxidase assembly protein CcoS [Gemmatimonas sp.]
MSVLFLLVPLAILLVAIFVGAYVWSTRTGQFDDLTTPAMRAVHDDGTVSPPPRPPEAR